MEFKVGEKVKIANSTFRFHWNGHIATITEIGISSVKIKEFEEENKLHSSIWPIWIEFNKIEKVHEMPEGLFEI